MEIESYVRGLARRRPDVVVTTLRLANLMGAGVDSHVTRYLSLPVVPRVMGFDARLQFLHPSDAVAALLLATRRDVPGTFNVAAADIVTLSQALRKMGRPSVLVPQPAAPLVATLVRQARLVDFSTDQIDALTYGRAMDTSRFTAETGFVPQYSSRAALEEFVNAARPGLFSPERVDGALAAVSQLLRSRDGARWLTRRSSSSAVVAVPAAAAGSSPSASARRLAAPQAARHSQPRRPNRRPDPPYESGQHSAERSSLHRRPSARWSASWFAWSPDHWRGLRSVPITQLRDFAADPVHGLVSVAQAFGVELGGVAGGNCGVHSYPAARRLRRR